MFLCGLLGTAVVLAGFVYFKPMAPLLPDEGLIPHAAEGILDRSDPSLVGQYTTSPAGQQGRGITNPTPDEIIADAATELKLPVDPFPIETEQLQREMERLAEELAQQFRDVPAAHHFAAQIWDGLHQTERAETAWRTAISMGTTAPGPYAGLANVLVQTGRAEEAIDLLTEAHSRGIQSAETVVAFAEALEHRGQLAQARQTMEQAAPELLRDEQWWDTYARILNQLGDYTAAEQAVRQAINVGGESESRLFLLTTTLARQGKREEARELSRQLQILRGATSAESSTPFQANYHAALSSIAQHAWLSAALLAAEQDQPQLAESYFRRVLELAPDNTQALMEFSTYFLHRRDIPKALAVQIRLKQVQPDNVFNYTNLASLWLQAMRPDRAEAILLEAVEIDPTGVLAQSALARLNLAQGNLEQARRWAAQVLARNESVESHVLLARVEEAAGNVDVAQQLFERARSLNPQHPLVQVSPP